MNERGHQPDSHGAATIEACQFEDVLPIWEKHLWPGRVSKIESNSAMKWQGGIDLELMQAEAKFWLARLRDSELPNDQQVVGVLSGHYGGLIDGVRSYRTRGLFVFPNYRGQGIAQALMAAAFTEARRLDYDVVWTFPRKSAMPAYEKMGFKRIGPWIGKEDPRAGEFGPNCYATRYLLHF